MEKPNRSTGRLSFKLILVAILLFAMLVTLIPGFFMARYARGLERTGERIPAQVVKIDTMDDGDGGTYYYVTLEYQYKGKTYARQDDSLGNSSTRVGDEVNIVIDPQNPQVILGDLKENAYDKFLFGALWMALCFAVCDMRTRAGWCESFGISQEMIYKDLLEKVKRSCKWLGIFLAGLCLLGGCLLIQVNKGRILISMLPLVIGLVGLCKAVSSFFAVRNRNYTVQKDRLQSKDIFTDSDDNDTYYLYYRTPEGRTYKIKTNSNNYQRAVIGEEILSVFLPGKSRPYMNIHLHDKSAQ